MVDYKIEWGEEALAVFRDIYVWYQNNMSQKAAEKFKDGILEAVQSLNYNPFLRKVEEALKGRKKEYRSLLEYPHHRIIYFIEGSVIYIAYIWDNRMDSKSISVIIK